MVVGPRAAGSPREGTLSRCGDCRSPGLVLAARCAGLNVCSSNGNWGRGARLVPSPCAGASVVALAGLSLQKREAGSPARPTQPRGSRDPAGLCLRGREARGSTRPSLVLAPCPCPPPPANLVWAGAGQVRPLWPSALLSVPRSRGSPLRLTVRVGRQRLPRRGSSARGPSRSHRPRWGQQGTERGHTPAGREAVAGL